jgi:hypothetical protein
VTVLVVYLNQVTLFLAFLSLHGRRVYAGQHCLTCRRATSSTISVTSEKGRGVSSACQRVLCVGRIPTTIRQDESFLEKWPRIVRTYFT